MSSFAKYWGKLTLSNRALDQEDAKVTLPVSELKRFMQKAYARGYDDRKELEEQLRKMQPTNPFAGLF